MAAAVEALGLTPVLNAAGKMTYLGGSACDARTAAALAEASTAWVDMAELMRVAGQRIADVTGAEAGFVTDCAAAGLAIATAACLTGGESWLVEQVPDLPDDVERRVVLQQGHAVDFGAPLTLMLRLGGARVVEVGTANRCSPAALAGALRDGAAALVHVVSHHVTGDELCTFEQAVELAKTHDVPLVVDAAAETDLTGYLRAGADLVVYSGHKAIGGPTSGLVCGRRDLVDACAAQNTGLGRAMKVGKESIVGLLVALDTYASLAGEQEYDRLAALVSRTVDALAGARGLDVEVVDDATRPIPRARVHVRAGAAGLDAVELVRRLADGVPRVRCRAHHAARGWFELDPRPLGPDDPEVLAAAVRAALGDER